MKVRGFWATAVLFGSLTALPFGLLMSFLMNRPIIPYGIAVGFLFGIGFGLAMGFFLRSISVQVAAVRTADSEDGVQMAMANIGYHLESKSAATYTFKPSFQAGLLSGRITATLEPERISLIGPAYYLRKLEKTLARRD